MDKPKRELALDTQPEIDPGNNKYLYSDVLFIVAVVTLGQGLCFLAVIMFLGDVTILPEDPLTLIGDMYLAMGIAFILLSKLSAKTGRRFFRHKKCSCILKISPQGRGEHCKLSEQHCTSSDNFEQEEYFSAVNAESNEKQKNEKICIDRRLKESMDQQWDMIDTSAETLDDDASNKNSVTIGCDCAIILTSKPENFTD
ncbi:uncharacterized protein LOC123555573 [Mercenaria mercenaria]|uniref:uncharacterized protein LOC123555573 n=1 Tax=Mercenaria mercenaria TaxID=6596 RepID=UPI001E1DD619|nr:uncharacterized protein LOC123555573 [Mercenaria mercenaria]XP_045202110.1 uncharacterized protein LOC123555573 [Mercenaria mercenaria]